LPLGIFGIATGTAVLPMFSQYVVEKKWEELSQSIRFALLSLANLMIPITIILIALGNDFIVILFKRGEFDAIAVNKTFVALMFYSLGLFFFSVNQTLVPLFYAHKDTKTPVKIAAGMVVVNIILNYILMQFLGHGGLALSTSITALLNCLIMLFLIRKRFPLINFSGIVINLVKITGINSFLLFLLLKVSALYIPETLSMLVIKSILLSTVTFIAYFAIAMLIKVKYSNYVLKRLWQRFHPN
ncbi:MAG: polysaccharide biosynthesis C-terminal domain-containing protein, partial [Candidatus Cloacimonetes bacterium]|nr:polysaccharide biosynthesis C-terminal domain-containing protein [Candidatus Cloacimonadota bacterium]